MLSQNQKGLSGSINALQRTRPSRSGCDRNVSWAGSLARVVIPDDWPFDQAPNVAAITTRQVIEDGLPILRVTHYVDDHSWAFVCGTTGKTEDGRVIGMAEALKLDPTLRTISDLPPGWTAWREAVGASWNRVENEKA
jgi:hypothetical protein